MGVRKSSRKKRANVMNIGTRTKKSTRGKNVARNRKPAKRTKRPVRAKNTAKNRKPTNRRKSTKAKKAPTEWNTHLMKVYREMKAKDSKVRFGDAMKAANKTYKKK